MLYIDEKGKLNLSNLHPVQKEFVQSKYLHTGIVGGYQSGKSLAATTKAITHLFRYPGVPIAYYLPTFRLFNDMLIPKITKILDEIGITFKHEIQHSNLIVNIPTPQGPIIKTGIWMRSMDTPDSIVSYSVGYSIVDEVDVVHPNKRDGAMKRIASRNSYKKDTANQIDFVSTPEGFSYMYNFFVKRKNDNKLLLKLRTSDNEENLADGYIQGLREQYTTEQLEAYLNGEFVNLLSGTCYYKFDRIANYSSKLFNENEHIHIGMDFNIGNMSAVIHIIEDGPVAVDEITKAYDTEQMIEIIKERYPNNNIFIYPDASGRNRSTNATITDIQLLKQAGFNVKAKDSNPLVKDRIKNMNRMFCNANNKREYLVNTHKCPEFAEALERMAYDSNGNPVKSSGFDHITDAAGYFISWEFPMANKNELNEYYSNIDFN